MQAPADYGPLYTETNFEQFPVEPLNAISNVFFLLVVVIWAYRTHRQPNEQFKFFLKVGLPLLLVGFVGGTVYHATRSHLAWMLMDIIPIYLIGLLTAVYHWHLIKVTYLKMAFVFLFLLVIPLIALWVLVPQNPNTPTVGYGILTLAVLLPLIWDQIVLRGRFLVPFLVPLILIVVALGLRAADSTQAVKDLFPVGTHFLWHTFGAATCHFLLLFMEKRSQFQA